MPDIEPDDQRVPVTLDYRAPAPRSASLSRAGTIGIGFVVGAVLWFLLFAIDFNSSTSDFYRLAIIPLVLLACAGGVLGAVARPYWLWGAAALSATTVVMGLTCFSFSGGASTPGAEHHLYVAAITAGCALGGALCGRMLNR